MRFCLLLVIFVMLACACGEKITENTNPDLVGTWTLVNEDNSPLILTLTNFIVALTEDWYRAYGQSRAYEIASEYWTRVVLPHLPSVLFILADENWRDSAGGHGFWTAEGNVLVFANLDSDNIDYYNVFRLKGVIYEVKGNTLILSLTKEFLIDIFNEGSGYRNGPEFSLPAEPRDYRMLPVWFFKNVMDDGQIAMRFVYIRT